MTSADDFDAAWDDIVFLEDRSVERGRREAQLEAQRRDILEGWHAGTQKGADIGQEVGFYLGFAHTRREFARLSDAPDHERRALKSLDKLVNAAEAFPAENIKDEDVLEKLENLRAKFKQCCAQLKLMTESPEGGSGSLSW